MGDSHPAILLNSLTKVYRRSHLGRVRTTLGVEQLSLTVEKGEVFGLLGLNGSGKTTTIKLILGLLFPTEGTVDVWGLRMPHPAAKTKMGYLPEMPYFYRYLSAREVLRFYGNVSGLPSETMGPRIESVLKTVRMTDHAHRPMREYSKGMLQRIGLAQAMLHDPEILIFDEPVTGLDPLGLKEMRELIQSLNAQGKTVFFSSHSISEVEKVCHRVGILVKGRLQRVISQSEWSQTAGGLEGLFVDVVTSAGPMEVR
ncbi:MAG TPA: ABC transporter ATP-binding protein [Elusimicrobiota bacterium]|nr:ABC transporter ATP-binding protein [Elusimicrobiota bacterium]